MSKKQSRLTGAILLMGAQAVVLLLGWVTHVIIGRLLGPGPYGLYGVVLSVQTIFGLFLSLGIPSAVSRFVAQNDKEAKSILVQALKLQGYAALTLAFLSIISAPVIASVLRDSRLTPLLMFSGLVIFLQAFYQIYVQFFSGLHLFTRQAILTSIYAVAKLAGALVLLSIFEIYGAFAGFAVGGIVASAIGWYWSRSVSSTQKKKLSLKEFLSFAGLYAFILAGLQILMSIDLFMIKSLVRDDIQTGYYNAAVTLSRISYFLLQGLSLVILPSVSALTKPGISQKKSAHFISQIIRYLVILIVPSITLASATSKPLITLFFSQEYIPAAPALTILMIGLGFLAFYLLLANIMAGAGKGKIALWVTGGMIMFDIIVGFILIPKFGLIGGALQTTITAFLGFIVLSYLVITSFNIKLSLRSIINIIIATIMAVAPTYIWKAHSLMLPVQYILLLVLYVAVLVLLKEVSAEDKGRLASIHPVMKKIVSYL